MRSRASQFGRRLLAGLAIVAATSLSARADDDPLAPHFTEETATAGVNAVYSGQWQYMVGGGAAAFDCMHDGRASVLIAGGEKPARFFRNVSEVGGALKFVEQTSGLELDRVVGAYPIDIDGDGEVDIVLLRVGEVDLMRGLGGCRFEHANEAWGFKSQDAWWTAFSATWEKGQKWPTLAFGSYVDRTKDIEPWGTCTQNLLYRPAQNDGAPQRQFAAPVALAPSYCPLSMLFTDWNRSGTQSLRVSNDREYYEGGQEQMWRIAPGEAPRLYTEQDGWRYVRIWGMGIASYDLTGSGYPDYFLTSMADQKLQRLDSPTSGGPSKPAFKEVAYPMGLSAARPYAGGDVRPSTGWHAQFEDFNNAGLADLFIAKGNVSAMPDFAQKDPNDLLMQRRDGKFVEMGEVAGIASYSQARGAALADFNLDGAIDLLVVNRNQPARVWRNDTPGIGHWIEIKAQDDSPNRDAIGGWIEVRCDDRVQRRELTVGGGHASGQLTWTHFGLGATDKAEVRVVWPDGQADDWRQAAADSFYLLRRGQAAEHWTPKPPQN
ncbi:MAG: CRTAC1 family protein [Bradyrhizobium sp.]|nr:MAG: CRTAC1 family protein [Bradyrhizobium sp.]